MNDSIRVQLQLLYGEAAGATAAARLAALLVRHRPPVAATAGGAARALTAADALLITYADQVREPDRAPLQTLADFARRHLRGVVSGVHILPFYPWSSDDGFSVMDFFAVDPAFGTWSDIARFRPQFDLMFDAVFNHMSARGGWFQKFLAGDAQYAGYFVTVEGNPDLSQVVRPRALPLLTEFRAVSGPKRVWTTFSADQVDLNLQNPEVLLAVLEVLLFYVRQGARFIRLDAIAYLWKEIGTPCIHLPQTHRVVQLMRAVLDEVAPHVLLLTETNVPHRDNVSYFGDGTNEAKLVYNFSLPPLTLHALQTGDATALTRWARSLKLPSDRVTWLNFLASHDGIGVNPARGILCDAEIEALVHRTLAHGGFVSCKRNADGSDSPYELNINYLDALSNPAAGEPDELAARKFLTAQAIMLSLPGVPGIYFHSLFGSRGDRAGADGSGIKRRINRQKLERAGLERELNDPASFRSRVFNGYGELLALRRTHSAFAPDAPQRVLELEPRVFAILRESVDGRDRVLCLHNVSAESVKVSTERDGFPPCCLAPFETRWATA